MSETIVKILKFLGVVAAALPVLGLVAYAGQKFLTMEEAVKSQKDQTEAIQSIQMQQQVFQVEQTHMKRSVDSILLELRENRAIMIRMLEAD